MTDDAVLRETFMQALRSPAVTEALIHRGRWLSARCLLEFGSESLVLEVARGVPWQVEHVRLLAPWDFAVRGSVRAWQRHWEPVPAPGWHDLFALTKRGAMRIEGSLQPLLANLQYVKDLLALPRPTTDS